MTSNDEKVNFEMNGTDLLLRDLNVYSTTRANHRAIIEQMKSLIMNNNTTGASIYDLGNVMQAESLSELNQVLKATERKTAQQRSEEQQHEQQMKQMDIDQKIQEKKMMLDHDSMENEKDRRKDLLVAEIKSAGYGAMQDLNANAQSDYLDALGQIQSTQEFQETMNFEQQKEGSKTQLNADKQQLAREKLQAQMAMKNTDLTIARENKNQFDVKAAAKKKEQSKKKK
jgi:hypothetical protein